MEQSSPSPTRPAKGPFISELRPGDRLIGFYLVRYKQLEPFRDRSRGEFLTLMLSDRTGQILARVWEGAPELALEFAEGDIVKVAGDVESYLGRSQVIIQKLRQAAPEEIDLADYQPSTEKNVEGLLATVRSAVDRIQEPNLAALVRRFFDDEAFVGLFAQAPATRRVHHAFLGGLLEHTVEALAVSASVVALYPDIDGDLLLAGVLLRDIGKTLEYNWKTDLDYTDQGRLVGHVVLGEEMVSQAIRGLPEFPEELGLRVRHMIVSHHGQPEWGAHRRPATLEAIALHEIEELTAQISRFQSLLAARREPGEAWTAYDRLLGRQLFAGRETDPDSPDGQSDDRE
jgi:3'-5' exoribonuclease